MFDKPVNDAYEKEQEKKRNELKGMGPGFDGVNWITANDSARRFRERMEKDAKKEEKK